MLPAENVIAESTDCFKKSGSSLDQFYVAPSDLTNSENGGLKFKELDVDDEQ